MPTSDSQRSTATARAAALRLLVVDDDVVDREATLRCLRRSELDFVADEASDIVTAREMLRQRTYDCVLLDNRLGEDEAVDLFAADAASRSTCSFILLTGASDAMTAVRAMKVGFRDYLLKQDIQPLQLQQAVESACEAARGEAQTEQRARQLQHLTLHDALTGLPNRKLFDSRLSQAIAGATRGDRRFAVMMIDLDGFKPVNDRFGHAAGDMVLVALATRLRGALRADDTLSRIGGDEFTALLPGVGCVEGAAAVAAKLCRAARQRVVLEDGVARVGVSIGVALFPEHGADAASLLRSADDAMYHAKRAGGGSSVYEGRADGESARAASIAHSLSSGIDASQFWLAYQPQVMLVDGRLEGVEALARWTHPQLGLVMPNEFIASAQRSSAIEPLTFCLLNKALAQARRWRRAGMQVPLSINLAPELLAMANLPERILECIDEHGIEHELLTLEVTETGVIGDLGSAATALRQLADAQVRVSLDDFGTGFSSMTHLRSLPISEIKLDRTFCRDVANSDNDEAIVRAVHALGAGLGVRVVAEGVENETGRDKLLECGVVSGQGFLFDKPLTASRFESDHLPPPGQSCG